MEINLRKKFLGNTGWLIFQNIYSMLLSLIIGSISARYLGPKNYGLIGYGASLVTLFTSVSKLGLDSVVINELVTNPERKGDTLGAALVMRLVASIICIICIVILVNIMEPGNSMLLKITFFQSLSILMQIYEVFNYWFQAELKSKYFVIAAMIGLTISSIWRIYLLEFKASVEFFALSSAIQGLIILIIILSIFYRMKDIILNVKISEMIYLFKRSHHFIIANLAITLYMQIDKIMLGKICGGEIVGFYTAAMTIATLWEFIPNAIVNSARPVVISDKIINYDKYIERLQFLLLFITLMGVIVGIGMTLFGRYIILILFGRNYIYSLLPLLILIWSTCLGSIGNVRSIWIVAEELYVYQKYMVIIGCIFNIFLNSILIPKFDIIGASIATLVSQFIVQFIAPMIFKETRNFINIYMNSFRFIKQYKVFGKNHINNIKRD